MTIRIPKVSIGLPVFNGEPYLVEAVESHLNQSLADFELIIVDNASTDATEEICRQYARTDSRIRYFRNSENIGVIRNHNLSLLRARGEYFKWSAADDIYSPTFLEKCTEVLSSDPETVLVFTKLTYIDENSRQVGFDDKPFRYDVSSPLERFKAALDSDCEEAFGVIRRSAMEAIPPMGSYRHYDGVYLTRLALRGPFRRVPEALAELRQHCNQVHVQRLIDYREFIRILDPRLEGNWLFPQWRLLFEYARSIQQAPLKLSDRARCFRYLAAWAYWRRRNLVGDIASNARRAAHAIARPRSGSAVNRC